MLHLTIQARNVATDRSALTLGVATDIAIDMKNAATDAVAFSAEDDACLIVGLDPGVHVDRVFAKGFTTQEMPGGVALNRRFRLVPEGSVTLSIQDPAMLSELTISLDRVTVPNGFDRPTTTLTVAWQNARRLSNDSQDDTTQPYEGRATILAVQADTPGAGGASASRPPLQVGWLAEAGGPLAARAADGAVAITPAGQPPIANRLAFRIHNTDFSPLVGPNAAHAAPLFTLSFVSVVDPHDPWRYDALCTQAEGQGIRCGLLGDDRADWSIDMHAAKLEWTIKPLTPQVLYARESIVIVIDNLVTSLPPYATAMYLGYRGLPGYDDGIILLPMEKLDAWPTIAQFDVSSGSHIVPQGGEVTLSWRSWGTSAGDPVPVSLYEEPTGAPTALLAGNLPAVGSHVVRPTAALTYYRLSLTTPGAPADARVKVTVGDPTVTAIAPTPAGPGLPVSLQFKTTATVALIVQPGDHRIDVNQSDISELIVRPIVPTDYVATTMGLAPATAKITVGVDYGEQIDVFLVIGDQVVSVNNLAPTVRPQGQCTGDPNLLIDFAACNGMQFMFGRPQDRPAPVGFFWVNDGLYSVSIDRSGQRNPFSYDPGQTFVAGVTGFNGAALREVLIPGFTWTADPLGVDDDYRLRQLSFAESRGFIALDSQNVLVTPGDQMRSAVESYDMTQAGVIFAVDLGSRHLLRMAPGHDWEDLGCSVAPNSTRIVASHSGLVYWVENAGPAGPILCCYLDGFGRQEVLTLPGTTPFAGIAMSASTIVGPGPTIPR